MATDLTWARYSPTLSPSLPQDALAAKNTAEYLKRLDAAGLARLAGALQAECTARCAYGAIAALGTAAGALEEFAREGRR